MAAAEIGSVFAELCRRYLHQLLYGCSCGRAEDSHCDNAPWCASAMHALGPPQLLPALLWSLQLAAGGRARLCSAMAALPAAPSPPPSASPSSSAMTTTTTSRTSWPAVPQLLPGLWRHFFPRRTPSAPWLASWLAALPANARVATGADSTGADSGVLAADPDAVAAAVASLGHEPQQPVWNALRTAVRDELVVEPRARHAVILSASTARRLPADAAGRCAVAQVLVMLALEVDEVRRHSVLVALGQLLCVPEAAPWLADASPLASLITAWFHSALPTAEDDLLRIASLCRTRVEALCEAWRPTLEPSTVGLLVLASAVHRALEDAGRLTAEAPFPFTLGEEVDLKQQFRRWMKTHPAVPLAPDLPLGTTPHLRFAQENSETDFAQGPTQLPGERPAATYLHFPRVLGPELKRRTMRLEAAYEMSRRYQSAFYRQAWLMELSKIYDAAERQSPPLPKDVGQITSPYLVLTVRREHAVEDVFNTLSRHLSVTDLRKPLKVRLVGSGEQGLDLGGVQKELFQVVFREIQNPAYGLFEEESDSRALWPHPLARKREDLAKYELIGMTLGLALYNNVALDLNFPLPFFEVLLGNTSRPWTLADLEQVHPTLSRSLQQLLNYDGDDVEAVFSLYFAIDVEHLGANKTVELIENGETVPVTNDNRDAFVALYIDYLLTKQPVKAFKALRRGFGIMCAGRALALLHSRDLFLMLCGGLDLDFAALHASTTYEGFSPTSPIIGWLWDTLDALSSEERRAFLAFVTGSDRVPVSGLGSVRMVVQRNGGDSDRLPTSLTCFSRLLLPDYASKERLEAW